jgi:predicted RecB family endonuclease
VILVVRGDFSLCLKNLLLKGSQTHHVAMLSPIAKTVTTVVNGRVTSKGSVTEALAEDKHLAEDAIHEKTALDLDEAEDKVVPTDEKADKTGQLIAAEEIIEGRLNWNSSTSPFYTQFI